MYEHMCVCECVCLSMQCEKQTGLYQAVKETKPPQVFIPEKSGCHGWVLREGMRESVLSLTENQSCLLPMRGLAPHLWGHLLHTVPVPITHGLLPTSSLSLLPDSQSALPALSDALPLNFPRHRVSWPKHICQVPSRCRALG